MSFINDSKSHCNGLVFVPQGMKSHFSSHISLFLSVGFNKRFIIISAIDSPFTVVYFMKRCYKGMAVYVPTYSHI